MDITYICYASHTHSLQEFFKTLFRMLVTMSTKVSFSVHWQSHFQFQFTHSELLATFVVYWKPKCTSICEAYGYYTATDSTAIFIQTGNRHLSRGFPVGVHEQAIALYYSLSNGAIMHQIPTRLVRTIDCSCRVAVDDFFDSSHVDLQTNCWIGLQLAK